MSKTIVQPTSKGQVTIPKSIRTQLRVGVDTLLSVSTKDGKIILQPVTISSTGGRSYTGQDIAAFLKADKISPSQAHFLKQILKPKK